MATLEDLVPQRLARTFIGAALAARIQGRPSVDHLRRLVAGPILPEDIAAADAWAREELRAVCHEEWGGNGPYNATTCPPLRIADELVRLRCALRALVPAETVIAAPAVARQEIPRPSDLEYLPFQRDGIAWAIDHDHSLIGDEPGLGKTIQALGVVNATNPGRVVVVCPATLKINWQREARSWLVSQRDSGIAQGNSLPDAPLLVINYDIVSRHVDALVERGIDLLVLDECHAIKSATSARTKACVELIRAAKRGVYLSGTPMLNRPVELLPLLKAVGSSLAENYERRYCDARMKDVFIAGGKGKKRRIYDTSGASNLDELRAKLRATFMIRRLKANVLKELPEKRRRVLALADVQGADELLSRCDAAWEAAGELPLRVIDGTYAPPAPDCDGTMGELARLRHEEALAKLPVAMDYAHELLEDEGIAKLVIFAHHRDVLEGIVAALSDFTPALLYGGMTPAIKQSAVDRFQADPECRVFVGSIQAAGVGITLTAASRVLMVELDWVPAVVTQAEDRCHRKGQRDSVLIEHLVLPGGIDDRICRALLRKQGTLDKALDA